MTALTEFERLEAPGVWHPTPDAQRIDVVLSVGDATLIIFDHKEMALAHWSLAAILRVNPGKRPAIFSPGEDAVERLEIDDDTMIRAIERVRRAVSRQGPHPGRLRSRLALASAVVVAGLAIFWLPGAVTSYAASIVPPAKRVAIGATLLERVERVSGQPCNGPGGQAALTALKERLGARAPSNILVVPSGVQSTAHLPGSVVLLNRAIVEDPENPDVVAGYVLAEVLRAEQSDPIRDVLGMAGLWATLKFMTTGNLDGAALESYAAELLTTAPLRVDDTDLLESFAQSGITSSPYAYAQDITGEATVGLIEADPHPQGSARPVLRDGVWVALQSICSE